MLDSVPNAHTCLIYSSKHPYEVDNIIHLMDEEIEAEGT